MSTVLTEDNRWQYLLAVIAVIRHGSQGGPKGSSLFEAHLSPRKLINKNYEILTHESDVIWAHSKISRGIKSK